jgi:CubicO group peptidase (beta-lactamase class C family)
MHRYLVFVIALAGLIHSGCTTIPQPVGTDEELPVSSLEAAGLESAPLNALDEQLQADDHRVHSVLVARGSTLVWERYYNGYGPENPHDLRSATKSITATLTGIALARGVIHSVDDSLSVALGDAYPDHSLAAIRIRDLLAMQSGLACNDRDPASPGQEERGVPFPRLDRVLPLPPV